MDVGSTYCKVGDRLGGKGLLGFGELNPFNSAFDVALNPLVGEKITTRDADQDEARGGQKSATNVFHGKATR